MSIFFMKKYLKVEIRDSVEGMFETMIQNIYVAV